jgi:hypothetical protein
MEKNQVKRQISNWEFFAKKGDKVVLPKHLQPLYPLADNSDSLVIEEIIKNNVELYKNSFAPKIEISFILRDLKKDLLVLDLIPAEALLPEDYSVLMTSVENFDEKFVQWIKSDINAAVDWYYNELSSLGVNKMDKDTIKKFFQSHIDKYDKMKS